MQDKINWIYQWKYEKSWIRIWRVIHLFFVILSLIFQFRGRVLRSGNFGWRKHFKRGSFFPLFFVSVDFFYSLAIFVILFPIFLVDLILEPVPLHKIEFLTLCLCIFEDFVGLKLFNYDLHCVVSLPPCFDGFVFGTFAQTEIHFEFRGQLL